MATPGVVGAEGDSLPGGVAVGDDSLGGMLPGLNQAMSVSGSWLRRVNRLGWEVGDGHFVESGQALDAIKTEPFMGCAGSPRLMILPGARATRFTHLSAPQPARQSFSFK